MLESKPHPPWQAEEAFPQPYYTFSKDTKAWDAVSSITSSTGNDSFAGEGPGEQGFRLITWNIDCLMPFGEERMAAGLEYLSTLYQRCTSSGGTYESRDVPLVIMLQEMLTSDLAAIQATPWIREHFYITDVSNEFWASAYYGTVTLIDKRFSVERAFRVHYPNTSMQRDGLFVDIAFPRGAGGAGSPMMVRLCNTHLESLVSTPPKRPVQLALAAGYMQAAAPSSVMQRWFTELPVPHGAALAGDLNAFMPEDNSAVIDVGLLDAYLVLGGQESTDEGYTWGQQVPEELRKAFGCSRMDKVLYCGGLRCERIIRIGKGVMARVKKEGEIWVTDHLGLMVDFMVVDQDSRDERLNSV